MPPFQSHQSDLDQAQPIWCITLTVACSMQALDVVQYIDDWYNSKRRHSELGMVSPDVFIIYQQTKYGSLETISCPFFWGKINGKVHL